MSALSRKLLRDLWHYRGLAAAVALVASSASRDDTLPMLTAVCLDLDGTALTLAATDRYRLAARVVPFEPADPHLRELLERVSRRTLAHRDQQSHPVGVEPARHEAQRVR